MGIWKARKAHERARVARKSPAVPISEVGPPTVSFTRGRMLDEDLALSERLAARPNDIRITVDSWAAELDEYQSDIPATPLFWANGERSSFAKDGSSIDPRLLKRKPHLAPK